MCGRDSSRDDLSRLAWLASHISSKAVPVSMSIADWQAASRAGCHMQRFAGGLDYSHVMQ